MRWLITGGCGFIGTNLIRNLVRHSDQHIYVVDDLSVGTRSDLADVADFIEVDISHGFVDNPILDSRGNSVALIPGDIRDRLLATRVVYGVDIIVHLAANTGVGPSIEDPVSDCDNNVMGTLNYLEAARQQGVKRLIFASSGAPVGAVDPPIHENICPRPVSPYGASKLAGEAYCSAYWGSFGLETVSLRFGNVYGPGSSHKGSVVAKFIKDALSGRDLEIHGDGTQTRDFIYVDDLVEAIYRAAVQPRIGGELFQIAANTETTVGELAKRVLDLLDESGVHDVGLRYSTRRQGDVKRNYSDISKAKQRIGWEPSHTLHEGLNKTIAYFMERKAAGSLYK